MNWRSFEPFFSPSEKWGNADMMQWYHVRHLFAIRQRLLETGCDWPFVIHGAYATSGHSPNSYHYKGMATDGHFVTDVPLREQVVKLGWVLIDLRLSDFMGIGIYPDWNNPGFHIDSRGEKKRWVRINGEYIYDMEIMRNIICDGDLTCKEIL